ncbi:hypothetical protein Tco_0401244 [Tanacetum coccineum]
MYIRNDPSFYLTNKTGDLQGEELGLIKLLSDSSSVALTTLSLRKAPIDKVPVLQVRHHVSNRFEIPLVESEGDPASPLGILQENLKLSVHPQVVFLQLVFSLLCSNMCQKGLTSF